MSEGDRVNPFESEDAVARVLEEYLAALEAGTAPPREEFLAAHPELADDLRTCLASLAFLRRANSGAHPTLDATEDESGRGRLGDFRLVRPIGRGGMGVVYEAEQISLGRRVALKVLPFAATLDPRQLQRFQNEARAAACLLHPNIVPVYAVGCDRGVHFYAMQLIDGQTLAQVIAARRGTSPADDVTGADTVEEPRAAASTHRSRPDRHAYFESVARLTIQAAEALDHAHAVDIVHRDVKPANLMVDTRGNLWVTDFGLARLGTDAGLTGTGDLLGTLRYMSPEQALGGRGVVDHRSDVYSLGATLYELLVLLPPFPDSDRPTLLRRIAEEEPRPPRRHDPAVPPELETITLKAMAKRPDERYATAREFADDLRRYLAGEPVRARPAGAASRVWKWARRHPWQTALVLVTLLGLVLGLAGSLLYSRNLGEALAVSDRLRGEAAEREARLRAHLYEADVRLAMLAWRHGEPEQARERLRAHLPAEGAEDLRGFEWHYLWSLCREAPGGKTLPAPLAGLKRLAVSPDGRWLVASNKTGTLRVWDLGTGREACSLRQGEKEIIAIHFSPDGKTLAASGQTAVIRLWDVATWTVAASLPGHRSTVRSLAFSPDGRRLASGSTDNTVRVWDVAGGKLARTVQAHADHVQSVAWSPDGKVLASAARDRLVKLWDPETGEELATLRGSEREPLLAVAFSGDGRALMATGYDRSMAVWDVARRVEVARYTPATVGSAICVVPNADLVATPFRDALALWDIGPSPNGSLQARELGAFRVADARLQDAVATPDGGTVIAAEEDGLVRLWETPRLRGGRLDRVPSVVHAVSPDGRELLAGDDLGVWIWNRPARTRGQTLWVDSPLRRAAFSPDGALLATAHADAAVALWDWPAGRQRHRWPGHGDVSELVFGPRGEMLGVGGRTGVRLWDTRSGAARPTAPEGARPPFAFAADGAEALCAVGQTQTHLARWNTDTGEALSGLSAPLAFLSLAVRPDGRSVVNGTFDTVATWNLTTGREDARRFGHRGQIHALAVSPDGRTLATLGGDGAIKLWRLPGLQELFTLETLRWPLRSIAFSPDGQQLVGVGNVNEGTTDVWVWGAGP